MRFYSRKCAVVFAVFSFFVLAYAGQAQTSASVDSYRAQLQEQLSQLEAQIEAQQKILDQAKTQQVSLERDIAVLNAQITQAKLAVKARDIAIQQLTSRIQEKENTIFGLNTQYNNEVDSLAGILREKNRLDKTSLVIAMLSAERLSDFFSDEAAFNSINGAIQDSFKEIQTTKTVTQKEKEELEAEREEETQLRQVQKLQQAQIQARQDEKNQILKETKGQEKAYQALIAANQKSAAQIRSALFQLTGSAAIPFGKALEYATLASQKTGIRPAFLLGIIAEESNLGQNVGTGTWTVDMHPTRDAPVFKAVTAGLGLNPDTMPVSKKPWYGWGGAMGPAQFIPSTWACFAGLVNTTTGKCGKNLDGSYAGPWQYDATRDRVGKLTGNYPPNPWNPEDAFMAAALYLTDSGAGTQTYNAEFKAAMCYLAGCGNVNNKSLQFYGNDVMSLAATYQQQIDVINASAR